MSEKRKDSKKRILKEGEYQRKNGTYEFKWRDAKGERHSIYAKTLDELRERELDILHDILDGISVESSNMTLDDLYERWANVKRGIKTVTFNKYKHDYNRYIKPCLGGRRLETIKSTDIRAFYNDLVDTMNFAVSTVGTIHRILHQILELGVDDDLIRKNPATKALKDFKSEHNPADRKNKAMTYQEQKLFESFLDTSRQYKRWQPLFITMLWTGLRAGELAALRWCDVDFDNEIIVVDHALSYHGDEELKNNRSHISSPKTASGTREIHMLPQVKDALLKEKNIQRLSGVKCTVEIDGYTDFF